MNSLSWRIPTSGNPHHLRLGLAQVGLASIVAGLVFAATLPGQWLAPALAGLVPLAIFMAYLRWRRYQQSMLGPDNVRLDDAGLHWLDASGQDRLFSRDGIVGFSIASSRDTMRPVPALSLQLSGGFESQPLELHPPATPRAVRDALTQSWQIIERIPADDDATQYDHAVHVYSECHEDFHEWHWEGSRDELSRLFSLVATVASEFPLPPAGAKPRQLVILASRREPHRLAIAHSPHTFLEHDVISAPASLLREIARCAASVLDGEIGAGDVKFDVRLAAREAWTFHLHVRE